MAVVPTYILAPNFTFIIDDDDSEADKWLGNIIQDPFNPRRILDAQNALASTGVTKVVDVDSTFSRSKGYSIAQSVYASFLQIAAADVGYDVARSKNTTYSMSELETRYLKRDPTDEEVTQRVNANPRVQTAMRAGIKGRSPVYMITGLKIAKGFSVNRSTSSEIGAHVAVEATVTPDGSVAVGTSHEGKKSHAEGDSFKSTRDIIFAYQLHLITHRGWRKSKRIEVDIFRSKAAFLSADRDGEQEAAADEMETNIAAQDDLQAFLEGDIEEGDVQCLSGKTSDEEDAIEYSCFYAATRDEDDE